MPSSPAYRFFKHKSSQHMSDCSLQHRRVSPFYSLSQNFEYFSHHHPFIAKIYYKLFYSRMLENELAMTNLKPGSKIIHIGSGPYPYTAIFLAGHGFNVEGWDCDYYAVEKAKLLVAKFKLGEKINIKLCDGSGICNPDCDAIWVSLNVCPKEKVLSQAFQSLKTGGLLVYRNLPRWMAGRYREVATDSWPAGDQVRTAFTMLGAQSIVIKKQAEIFSYSKLPTNNRKVALL